MALRVGRADGLVRLCAGSRRWCGAARAVARVTGGRYLDADVTEALFHPPTRALFDLGEAGAAGVVVAIRAVPHFAAEQLIERHPGALALDVPQRDVDAAHRVEEHRTVAPVRAHVARLPDVLDLVDVAPDEERLQVLLDRRLDDQRALGEGGAAPADQSRLGRLDLHHDQPDPVGRGQDGLDVADLDGTGAAHRLRVGGSRRRCERTGQCIFRCEQGGPASQGNRAEQITAIHRAVSLERSVIVKSQAPSSKSQALPAPKSQAPNLRPWLRATFWHLAIGSGWSLGFGAWDLS